VSASASLQTARSMKRDPRGALALIPAPAGAQSRGRQRVAPAHGALEPAAEVTHRLQPAIGVDPQPIEDRRKIIGDSASLARNRASDTHRFASFARGHSSAHTVGTDPRGLACPSWLVPSQLRILFRHQDKDLRRSRGLRDLVTAQSSGVQGADVRSTSSTSPERPPIRGWRSARASC
jgi:hypothetical protein